MVSLDETRVGGTGKETLTLDIGLKYMHISISYIDIKQTYA